LATPTFIGGKGYGPVCAAKLQPLAPPQSRPPVERKPKRARLFSIRRKAKPDDPQLDLLQQLEAT
jgi:hypothetical protein